MEFSLVTSVNCPNSVLPIKQGNVYYNYHVKRSFCIDFSSYSVGKIHGNRPLGSCRHTMGDDIKIGLIIVAHVLRENVLGK